LFIGDFPCIKGITGTCMDKRDDLHRLIRDCKKGLIDRIIVKSVSRFARNTQELLATIRFLKDIGVSVYFEEQGIDTDKLNSEMIVTFPGMAAQQESESISGNMRWSYKKRMESGDFNCCAPAYGFDLIDGNLVINETEAVVVRRIFTSLLSFFSAHLLTIQSYGEKLPYEACPLTPPAFFKKRGKNFRTALASARRPPRVRRLVTAAAPHRARPLPAVVPLREIRTKNMHSRL